jgi:hypothetical protein
MTARILPFNPSVAAELTDADTKRLATARARCALLGAALYRRIGDGGAVTFIVGLRKFRSLDEVESYLDTIGVDE